ncbi:hypothetical protein REMIM1_PF00023 (plasmid) [Rhizobium etli bv. mimosae str. Mim1]|nr:hypothetical protein REMIM1_PF00023 [Rhizobium etli bv. mimosae str. Mim1]
MPRSTGGIGGCRGANESLTLMRPGGASKGERLQYRADRSPARESAPGFDSDRQHGRRSAVHQAEAAKKNTALRLVTT